MIKKIILGISVAMFVACGSDSNDSPIVPPVQENPLENRIVKIEQVDNSRDNLEKIWEFAYDNQHRLVSVVENSVLTKQIVQTELTYKNNAISILYKEEKRHPSLRKPTEIEVKLNNNQRVTELKKQRFPQREEEKETVEEDFVYDAQQRQTTCETSFYEVVRTSWSGKNISKIESEKNKGTISVSQTYQYTDKINKVYPDVNFFLAGFSPHSDVKYLLVDVLGLRSANYISQHTFTTDSNPTQSNFTYEFDQKQRPIKITKTEGQNSKGTSYIIHYAPGL